MKYGNYGIEIVCKYCANPGRCPLPDGGERFSCPEELWRTVGQGKKATPNYIPHRRIDDKEKME